MNCLADGAQWVNCACNYSPIVIQLASGARYDITAPADGVWFDLNGDGTPERSAWTPAGSTIAFLALDTNANGVIDSGLELFGGSTRLANGKPAQNGFIALAELEQLAGNGDGQVDSSDAIYGRLLLWTDSNHNGTSEPDELVGLVAGGVVAISVDFHEIGRRDLEGNLFRFKGRALVQGRQSVTPKPIYDVFLKTISLSDSLTGAGRK